MQGCLHDTKLSPWHIAFVAYWILYSLLKNTKLAGSGDMTIEEACSVAQ